MTRWMGGMACAPEIEVEAQPIVAVDEPSEIKGSLRDDSDTTQQKSRP